MSEPKLGVIGAGAFTDFVLASYRQYLPTLKLGGITDPKAELARQLAKKYALEKVYSDNEALLADHSIDLVLILTPPNTHYALAKQALLAGKHVLVEKPIAFTEEEARELLDIAERRDRRLSANLVLRHHPFHQEIAQAVKTNRYGRLRQITTTALLAEYPKDHWYWDRTVSGGFFLNTFCHFLDLYDFISHQTPDSFQTTGSIDNGLTIVATYPLSLTASLNVNVHVSNSQERVETSYIFDEVVILTRSWLPEEMIITTRDGSVTKQKSPEKLTLYHQLLAEIMRELLERIVKKDFPSLITHAALLQAVINPTRAEQN